MIVKGRVGALIPAAGYSSRMGAFKPLLPVAGSTVLETAIARLRRAGIADIQVVVGYRAELITPLLAQLGVRWVLNEEYDRGMLSSVLTGVRGLDAEVDAFLLLPADIPLVKSKTIQTLYDRYCEGDATIVYPCFHGERGHPPIITTAIIPGGLSNEYPGGLRAFLSQYQHVARDVEVADEGILMDCDTPADYERLKAYGLREDIPTERECQALWVQFNVPERVIAHSRMVAHAARLLAVHLNRKGLSLDLDLIVAAGYLHDLAKGQPNHAEEGSRILSALGYPRVGALVGSHMDISYLNGTLTESDLIYLADKLVQDDRLVTLEDHFSKSAAKFVDNPEILRSIENRLRTAQLIQQTVERVMGQPLRQVAATFERNIRAASRGERRTIYLVRHGAVGSEDNKKRFIGQLDLPLSREGIAQVQSLRNELCETEFAAVFCSDLRRSVETAAILTEARPGLSFSQRPELREISLGQWEGLTFGEVMKQYPGEFENRGCDIVHYQPPGGESFLDCTKRVLPAFHDLLHTTRGDLLIVGHAGVNRIILCQALGLSLAKLFEICQDYACLNVITFDNGAFTVTMLNGKPV